MDRAVGIAAALAFNEARRSGKTDIVASTLEPRAIYTLRFDHPDLADFTMNVMYEITAAGETVARNATRH